MKVKMAALTHFFARAGWNSLEIGFNVRPNTQLNREYWTTGHQIAWIRSYLAYDSDFRVAEFHGI